MKINSLPSELTVNLHLKQQHTKDQESGQWVQVQIANRTADEKIHDL
jgi:hypothetical protein